MLSVTGVSTSHRDTRLLAKLSSANGDAFTWASVTTVVAATTAFCDVTILPASAAVSSCVCVCAGSAAHTPPDAHCIQERHREYARLSPEGSTGMAGVCVHTPSRAALPVGRHATSCREERQLHITLRTPRVCPTQSTHCRNGRNDPAARGAAPSGTSDDGGAECSVAIASRWMSISDSFSGDVWTGDVHSPVYATDHQP